jgi:NAD(P)-dependent dehydrogenase (short-subunit alcohol dehydrogenase family)
MLRTFRREQLWESLKEKLQSSREDRAAWLASAKRFVEEGAYVFITGRRQEQLDEAVKLIGRNVTGVRGDVSNLDDLDRLFETVKREKGKIDVLYASAGTGEAVHWAKLTNSTSMRPST